METIDQYRFENGSLYILNKSKNAYIHCWKTTAKTKKIAIEEFENDMDRQQFFSEEAYDY